MPTTRVLDEYRYNIGIRILDESSMWLKNFLLTRVTFTDNLREKANSEWRIQNTKLRIFDEYFSFSLLDRYARIANIRQIDE